MAFPSSTSSREALSNVLSRVRSLSTSVKQTAQTVHSETLAGPITGKRLLQACEHLFSVQAQFTALRQTPGLAAYAREQFNDPAFDIGVEFQTMQAALQACLDWINTNLPRDAANNRWLLLEEFVDGVRKDRMFSSAAFSGLRPLLITLIESID